MFCKVVKLINLTSNEDSFFVEASGFEESRGMKYGVQVMQLNVPLCHVEQGMLIVG